MLTGKIPLERNFWRAAAVPSASMIPDLVFPFASKAVYSYTGILDIN
jgi:hypothetical protein